ncbi:MAG: alpha/beta hydrolase [Lachnospiraceae bacterium]
MEKEVSLRGRLIRQLIAGITNDLTMGEKIKNGELRKKMVEPPWHCPRGYRMEQIKFETFEVYELIPEEKKAQQVILQFHGGGYIAPLKNAYFSWAYLYSKLAGGCRVVTVEYRVAPEHPYPAALEDAWESYLWLLKRGFEPKDIVVVGDSAGGGLSLALLHYLKDQGKPLPAGVIAMSPWTDLTLQGESYVSNFTNDPLFGNSYSSLIFNRDYIGDKDPTDPYLSPLYGDFTGFPPMLLQVGSLEMLLSDSTEVAKKAKKQGVKVRCSVYEGMFHEFQMAGRLLPESRQAWDEVGEYFSEIGFGI